MDHGGEGPVEDWLTVTEAMRVCGVKDPRTIRKWCDDGILVSQRTFGGHRRILASSINQAFRPGNGNSRAKPVDPASVIIGWAAQAEEWDYWEPSAATSDDQLARIRRAAVELAGELQTVIATITEALNERDSAALR